MSDEPDAPVPTPDTDGADADPDAAECLNCGAVLHGAYCHDCGQRHLSRLRLRTLLRNFADAFLNVTTLGGGLWTTLRIGARTPGRLARRYVEGERQRFINPIGYILIVITLLFVVYTLLEGAIVQTMTEMYRVQLPAMGVDPEEAFAPGGSSREVWGWRSMRDMAQGVFAFIRQTQTYITLLFCLGAAGLLRVVFADHTYAELVVFVLYAAGQGILYHLLVLPFFLFASVSYWFALGPPLLLGVLALSGRGFFGPGAKGWLLPPLAYVGAYVGTVLLSILVGVLGAIGVLALG